MAFYNKAQERTIRQEVLDTLVAIRECSTSEFTKDCKRVVYSGNSASEIITQDSRKVYVQLVEYLSSILLPFFDKEMFKIYEEAMEVLSLEDYEYATQNEEEIKQIWKFRTGQEIDKLDFKNIEGMLILKKLKYAKGLFVEINKLLKRQDYLKQGLYSESDLEDATYEEEGE